MASPPYSAGLPPGGTPLAQPRQRPTLALPTGNKSRKPSLASASSAHPLRQTSFPPDESLSLEDQHALAEVSHYTQQYSPSADGDFDEFSDDNDIQSAISGPASSDIGGVGFGSGKKRKRGDKRPRGRPSKAARGGSIVNGDDARSQTHTSGRRGGTADPADPADADAEDDDEDEEAGAGPGGGRVPLYEGGQMTPAEREVELQRRNAFYETVPPEHQNRFDSYTRAKLKTGEVRKLINATLSQSVPQNVVLAVGSYAKMFAGMLIEEARQVQAEWTAVEEKRADGGENRALGRIRKSQMKLEDDGEQTDGDAGGGANGTANGGVNSSIKPEPTSPANGVNGHTSPEQRKRAEGDDDVAPVHPGGAGGLEPDVHECDRGPLLPDHLREALRRYKKRRADGPVGFTGLSLEGRENTAPRMGGRRLFK